MKLFEKNRQALKKFIKFHNEKMKEKKEKEKVLTRGKLKKRKRKRPA